MKTKKTKQVSGPTSQAPRLVLSIALVIGFFGYILTFLQQTSLFGFVDAQGQAHNRLVDLLVIPDLMWGVFGDGTDLGLLDRLPILAGAAAWLTIAAWIGWACVSFLSTCSKLQRIVLATLAGLAILSTTMLFLGMAGCLASRWPLVISVGGLMLLSGFLQNRARKRDLSAARQPSLPPDGEQFGVRHLLGADGVLSAFMFRWVQIAACILAALYVLGSALPAWEFDVLEYHLQAPKEFHEAGRIGFVNHNVYANMPLGAEMHTLAAMTLIGGANAVWWGALIGKSIIGSYSLLCAALVGSVVADRLGKLRGWSAAGLLLAVPGSVHVSWAGLIDMVLSTYVLATWVAIEPLIQRGCRVRSPFPQVFLGALFAGAAAACKYPGFIFAVVPMLLVVLLACLLPYLKSSKLQDLTVDSEARNKRASPASQAGQGGGSSSLMRLGFLPSALAVFCGLSLTCLPWLVKNAVVAGNPVYPLMYQYFGGRGFDVEQAQRWVAAHRPGGANADVAFSWPQLLNAAEQLTLTSPLINPSLVFLGLCGTLFLVPYWQRFDRQLALEPLTARWLTGCVVMTLWILLVWWLATHRIDRFWLPIVPLVACLAALGMTQMASVMPAAVPQAIALVGILYGIALSIAGAGLCDNRLFVQLRSLREQARDVNESGLVSPVAAWANGTLDPASTKLLLLGDAMAFSFEVPIAYATCFNTHPAEGWLRDKSPEEQLKQLRSRGITHVLVNWSEIARYRSPGNYGFSDWPQPADIQRLVDDRVLTRLDTPFDSESVAVFGVAPRL